MRKGGSPEAPVAALRIAPARVKGGMEELARGKMQF